MDQWVCKQCSGVIIIEGVKAPSNQVNDVNTNVNIHNNQCKTTNNDTENI